MKLNLKNKKFLDLLLEDFNQSSRKMADKLNISTQAILKKKRLVDQNLALKYHTVTNYFKIGYNNLHVYLNLREIERYRYKQIVSKLEQLDSINWVCSFFGEYDIGFSILYSDMDDLHFSLNEAMNLFKNKIHEKKVYFIYEQLVSPYYFIEKSLPIKLKPSNYEKLDSKDRIILNYIKNNPRFDLKNMSKELMISVSTIKRRIDNLKNKNIILRNSLLIDYSRLGLHWTICMIEFTSNLKNEILEKELSEKKEIPFLSVTIDNVFIFDYICGSHENLKRFLNNIQKKYSISIKNYKILEVNNLNKL